MRQILVKVFAGVFLLFCSAGFAKLQPDPFVLITFPKSGTHLLIKSLHLLYEYDHSVDVAGTKEELYEQIHELRREKKNLLYHFHVDRFDVLEECLKEHPKIKKVLLIRDLRDVAVSIMRFHIQEEYFLPILSEKTGISIEHIQEMSDEEQLTFAIQYLIPFFNPNDALLRYFNDPSVHVIRYEDLVGRGGGGSDQKRHKCLLKLIRYLNTRISLKKLKWIEKKMYGNQEGTYSSYTFRTGKIGGWKEVFTREHKELFKKLHGKKLIDLGYVANNDW